MTQNADQKPTKSKFAEDGVGLFVLRKGATAAEELVPSKDQPKRG